MRQTVWRGVLSSDVSSAAILKVNALIGTSASVAVTVKVKRFPSTTLRFPIGVSTGGALTSLTTMLMVSAALILGEPLSVTDRKSVVEGGTGAFGGVRVNTYV